MWKFLVYFLRQKRLVNLILRLEMFKKLSLLSIIQQKKVKYVNMEEFLSFVCWIKWNSGTFLWTVIRRWRKEKTNNLLVSDHWKRATCNSFFLTVYCSKHFIDNTFEVIAFSHGTKTQMLLKRFVLIHFITETQK